MERKNWPSSDDLHIKELERIMAMLVSFISLSLLFVLFDVFLLLNRDEQNLRTQYRNLNFDKQNNKTCETYSLTCP